MHKQLVDKGVILDCSTANVCVSAMSFLLFVLVLVVSSRAINAWKASYPK